MSRYSKMSLLQKYDLQIDQLDYSFIGACKNVKTLERILIVLRSGQEGVYPDLIKFCENRLRELAPNSRHLHLATRVKKFSDLPETERRDIESQLEDWYDNAEDNEKNKSSPIHLNKDMPPIRGKSVKIETAKKKDNATPCAKMEQKRSSQRSYSEWDKFDVEEELKKLDESESNGNPKPPNDDKKTSNSYSDLQPLRNYISDLSEKERQHVADMEKNKGNEAFKAHDYGEAIFYYTRSLVAYKSVVALNNRAQAYIEMNHFVAAIQDCNKVILMDPNNIKALYRRGVALKGNELYDLAEMDFRTVLELDPENKSAKKQLKQMKQMKQIKPEKKKVIIEEIKSEEIEKPKTEIDSGVANTKCTRMKIEEVTTTENMEKLTNINYSSSDEDESTSHLPVKVKQMLQVNKTSMKQKEQTSKIIDENKIEKTSIRETKRSVQKMKIIEECEQFRLKDEKNKCDDKLSTQNSGMISKKKSGSKVSRINLNDMLSNTQNHDKSNKCLSKTKQLNNTNSIEKEVDLKIAESVTNTNLMYGKKQKPPKETTANEDKHTESIKYKTKTQTLSTDFGSDNNIIDEQRKNDKIYMGHISNKDNTRKSNEKRINSCGDKAFNDKENPDSRKLKDTSLGNSVLNQNKLDKSDEYEITNKEFDDQTINDKKLCNIECLKKQLNEGNLNGGTGNSFKFSEGDVLNSKEISNVKDDNARMLKKELSSGSEKSLNEVVFKTQKDEISKNKTDYSFENTFQKEIISTTKIAEKMVGNNLVFDAVPKTAFLREEQMDVSDPMINISQNTTRNGIQMDQRMHNKSFSENIGLQINEDITEYSESPFLVQDNTNSNTSNKVIDDNIELQIVAHTKIGNYKTKNLDYCEEEMHFEEHICDNTAKNKSEICKTESKKDSEESEEEFVDVENDYPLQEISIQKSEEKIGERGTSCTNSSYETVKECSPLRENFQSALNSSKSFEEKKVNNVCFLNDIKGNNSDYDAALKEGDIFIKDAKISKATILEKDIQYEKVSPYEFLCSWCFNDEKDEETRALNLLKLKPEELPQVISNKLDAPMLAGILKAINVVCKTGKCEEGEKYLYYLTQVPRLDIAAMFLTKEEAKSILDLYSELGCEHGFHMKYVKMILQP